MARRTRPPRAGALNELPPAQIAAQIATLQGLFYACALVLMLFTSLVAGDDFGLDLVLSWDRVRADTTRGWLLSFVWLFDGGFCTAVAIVIFIARSKLVPDFALTVHVLHLVLTSLYSRSIPRHGMWWATMAASAALATALGVWGCRYRELQPVFFGGARVLGGQTQPDVENGAPPDMEEEVDARRGRGRGRDTGGPSGEAFEMARLNKAA